VVQCQGGLSPEAPAPTLLGLSLRCSRWKRTEKGPQVLKFLPTALSGAWLLFRPVDPVQLDGSHLAAYRSETFRSESQPHPSSSH
jgi:hypothetical protein